jgi:hypothetical protein
MADDRLQAITWAARAMLEQRFAYGDASSAPWRPEPEDYDRVFNASVAAGLRFVYDVMWEDPPIIGGRPEQTLIHIEASWSHQIGTPAAANAFPGGYGRVAPLLRPNLPWVCFTFTEPGDLAGMAFDGLVLLDDRWVWFPKPWRSVDAWRAYQQEAPEA